MEKVFIHPTAVIKNSKHQEVKLFRNVLVEDSTLADNVAIGDDTTIQRCSLDSRVQINRRNYINDSKIGRYTYTGINTIINFAEIGAFCSIARNVDIGGKNHDYRKITTMEANRFAQMLSGGGKLEQVSEQKRLCKIGNDVWIASGALILRNVTVGDGAVIGAGAVVTHDIPPYAIAVGVPAKVIGYRCDPQQIERLLKIGWWNWDDRKIRDNMNLLLCNDISDDSLNEIESIK